MFFFFLLTSYEGWADDSERMTVLTQENLIKQMPLKDQNQQLLNLHEASQH